MSDSDLNIDFSKLKKKKKKRRRTKSKPSTDTDYSYTELLTRIYSKLKRQPTDKRIIQAPRMGYQGRRRSVILNFRAFYRGVNRPPNHIANYLISELSTVGSLDSQSQLILKGYYKPTVIETLLRKYIIEYVVCRQCKGIDTVMVRINRLFFVKCGDCGSSHSVPSTGTKLANK
jgi:translation initiation factor 2 subunit 2